MNTNSVSYFLILLVSYVDLEPIRKGPWQRDNYLRRFIYYISPFSSRSRPVISGTLFFLHIGFGSSHESFSIYSFIYILTFFLLRDLHLSINSKALILEWESETPTLSPESLPVLYTVTTGTAYGYFELVFLVLNLILDLTITQNIQRTSF